MFPRENLYIYKGSKLNVLCPFNKTPFNKQIFIDGNTIYLGKYIKSKTIDWTNHKKIIDGLAIFEHGCIYFPNYRNIAIMSKNMFPHLYKKELVDCTSKVSFNDDIIYIYDIYNEPDNFIIGD